MKRRPRPATPTRCTPPSPATPWTSQTRLRRRFLDSHIADVRASMGAFRVVEKRRRDAVLGRRPPSYEGRTRNRHQLGSCSRLPASSASVRA